MADREYTAYQLGVIRRYYQNQGTLLRQRLADLVGELYLAPDKQRGRLWKRAAALMKQLNVPASRSSHILQQADPRLLARLVQELENAR
jgi:hypothetical protein